MISLGISKVVLWVFCSNIDGIFSANVHSKSSFLFHFSTCNFVDKSAF